MSPHEVIPPVHKASRLGVALRWAGIGGLAIAGGVVVLALVVVATVAALIGLVVAACAVIALRFSPSIRRQRAGSPGLLEGRRTADGWVAEAVAPKSR